MVNIIYFADRSVRAS